MTPIRDWVFRSRRCILARSTGTMKHLLAYTELPRESELWPQRRTLDGMKAPGVSREITLAGLLPDQSYPGFWLGLDWADTLDKLPAVAHVELEALVNHLLTLEKEMRRAAPASNHSD